MTTIEVLRGARALLVERGWCQGVVEDGDGRLCMVGACKAAAGKHPDYAGDWGDASRACEMLEKSPMLHEGGEVATWKDDVWQRRRGAGR